MKSEVIINGIADSSNYQATAVSQINQAITQVSQVVQTTSATSEECAAASEELSNLAARILMAKPVDKARQIRYNFYGILIYWTYLIIPRMADSSESAFLFLDTKKELLLQ